MKKLLLTFSRITVNPNVFGGKPCIRNLRFSRFSFTRLDGGGLKRANLSSKHIPILKSLDVDEALAYAGITR